MPEYLAPAVFVEETSFRSKSIEGVSTSTTGFAGPARKGPVDETPQLVTSYAEFVRIFGGFGDLALYGSTDNTNYLAHSVRAYFNEGGARLYVARVFQQLTANPINLGGDPLNANGIAATTAGNVALKARFPGSLGNGKFVFHEDEEPATKDRLDKATVGTIVSVGADGTPAVVTANTSVGTTFDLNDGDQLLVRTKAGGTEPKTITFSGKPARVETTAIANAQLVSFGPNKTLTVRINKGVVQSIALVDGSLEGIVARINKNLRGGYAEVVENTQANTKHLAIATDAAGKQAAIQLINPPAELEFVVLIADNSDSDDNNVDDIHAVRTDEITKLFDENDVPAIAYFLAGKLTFETTEKGKEVHLTVVKEGTANPALGFTNKVENTEGSGTGSSTKVYYSKVNDGSWKNEGETETLTTTNLESKSPSFVSLMVTTIDADGEEVTYENLAVHEGHPRSMRKILGETPLSNNDHVSRLFALTAASNTNVITLLKALLATRGIHKLSGGHDGMVPTADVYENGLTLLGGVEDISILAAPGSSAYGDSSAQQSIRNELIMAAEKPRAYRIAVIDPPKDGDISMVRALHDSHRAALYYPWVVVANPLARPGSADPRELVLPPSGFVAGIYARNDIERGVWKAPANEVVRSALRFETDVNFNQQEVLNPRGINCLRYLAGRGYRVWGARTMSSDPEWKYVNVRRYFNYLERSIDVGTQWAVFEPNGERLWANIRETINSFLYNEWRSGALLGSDAKQAYFVRCDRSTMTQNDLDNGRLVCLIGVAVVKPAEFVIFRIGQKTADADN